MAKSLAKPKTKFGFKSSQTFFNPLLAAFIVIFAAIGGYAIYRSFAAGASCTTTVSSVSAAQSAVSSAAGGSVICMSAGSYGALSLSGTHTSNVTVQPDPALDPNGAGKVTLASISISGSYITIHNFYVTGGIDFSPPANHDSADHNDVTNSAGNYGINVSCNGAASQPGCSFITINGNRVHDLKSSSTDDGDALRLDGWSNVTITANEITRVEQQPGGDQGHTDCLQSYNANVATHDIVYDHNYIHDDQCQVFFLKDGDVANNVTFTDNLSLRTTNLGDSDTSFWLADNTQGAIIRNNTMQGGSSAMQALGTAPNPSATMDHNVFDQVNNLGGYTLTENHNIFTDGNEWSFTPNSTDTPTTYGTLYTPSYMCASSCGNGTVAGDDYRLASNPSGIGVDWAPSQYTYGPVNTSGSTGAITQSSDCFASPGACGYPDPAFGTVGVPAGTTLTPSGSITTTTNGQIINGLDVTGSITVQNSNVTIENTRVTDSGNSGIFGIYATAAATGLTIKNSTVRGSSASGSGVIESALFNGYHVLITVQSSYFYNEADPIEYGPVTVTDSYLFVNTSYTGAHNEDIYTSDTAVTVNHSVLFNNQEQTATVFGDTQLGGGGPADNHITVTNSLVAGGGFMIYADSASNSVGSSTMDIESNRFARCLTSAVYNSSSGGSSCSGGQDSFGFWPYGGYFGLNAAMYCGANSSQIWSNNVWDDNNVIINCDGTTGGQGGTGDTTPPTVSLTAPANGATVSGSSVTLSANASDNVGVSSVQFKFDGNSIGPADTVSPYTVNWNTTAVSNGTHTLTAVAFDAAGNSTTSSSRTVTVSNAGVTCSQSSTSWQNTSITVQSGTFSASFDTTPTLDDMNGVTGLSSAAATDYPNLAVIVRFNPSGFIDARNGDNYVSDTNVPYSAGTTYHIKLTVNMTAKTYTVYVTPQGGSQITLGTNYAFRTEQSGVTSLSNWATKVETGSHSVCNFSLSANTPLPGDVNSDGHVNATDLSILLSNWNTSTSSCDFNIDGKVNILDLSVLLGHYGT